QKGAGRWVVSVDGGVALAEVSDEERAAEDAERGGRNGDTPRRVERAVVNAEGRIANAIGIEPPDESIADSVFGVTAGSDFRINNIDRAANVLNVIRVEGIARRG